MPTNNSDNYSPVQYNSLVGGTNGSITSIAPSSASGIPLISEGSSANPAFGTAQVIGGGTGATTLPSNNLLIGNGTSAVTGLGAASNGQIPIGSTGSTPVLSTITAGANVTVTNGPGSITIASTGGGGSGSFVLLSTQVVNPASPQFFVNFTSVMTTAYNSYKLVYYNVKVAFNSSPSNTWPLALLPSADNGVTFLQPPGTLYETCMQTTPLNTATWSNQNTNSTFYIGTVKQDNISFCSGTAWLINTADASAGTCVTSQSYTTGSPLGMCITAGSITTAAAVRINAITLSGPGNFTSGTFSLYGIPE